MILVSEHSLAPDVCEANQMIDIYNYANPDVTIFNVLSEETISVKVANNQFKAPEDSGFYIVQIIENNQAVYYPLCALKGGSPHENGVFVMLIQQDTDKISDLLLQLRERIKPSLVKHSIVNAQPTKPNEMIFTTRLLKTGEVETPFVLLDLPKNDTQVSRQNIAFVFVANEDNITNLAGLLTLCQTLSASAFALYSFYGFDIDRVRGRDGPHINTGSHHP